MAPLRTFSLIVCFAVVYSQTTVNPDTFGRGMDFSKDINDLRFMLQALQTQNSALRAQVSAIHGTLLTQQTMAADEICQILEAARNAGPKIPADCVDILEAGNTRSGVYAITPAGLSSEIQVYCDMETDGGGWTIIQRRLDGKEDFFRSYAEYENGFGNVTAEHYLGNKNIHALTKSGNNELLIELEDFQRNMKTAHYDNFSIGDANSKYKLHVEGYNGTAGDSLIFDHNGHAFSTYDSDNDGSVAINCAEKQHGGYWYSACFKSNLNGRWGTPGGQGIVWGSYKDWTLYVLKRTEMKIRRPRGTASQMSMLK